MRDPLESSSKIFFLELLSSEYFENFSRREERSLEFYEYRGVDAKNKLQKCFSDLLGWFFVKKKIFFWWGVLKGIFTYSEMSWPVFKTGFVSCFLFFCFELRVFRILKGKIFRVSPISSVRNSQNAAQENVWTRGGHARCGTWK